MLSKAQSNIPINETLQKFGAISAFAMALCYISLFIIYGAVLSFPQTGNVTDTINYVAEQFILISVANSIGYLLFGCLLLITIQAMHNKMQVPQSALLNSASLFGLIWVGLMMCSGMISLIGMDKMLELHNDGSEQSVPLFYAYNTIVNALGGGVELVGGLWVLLLSLIGLREKRFPKFFNYLGLWVGVFGIATIFHTLPGLKEVFGLSQIIWFFWISFVLAKKTA